MEVMRVTPVLEEAEALHDYVVRLTYADGVVADVDLAYMLDLGPVFDDLRSPGAFRRLRASRAANTVIWPNGADIAPETLYELAKKAAPVTS